MKGSYNFIVRSKKVVFQFKIRRNITVIKGDSASGKTTLLNMMYEYLRVKKESGFLVTTDANYYVYIRQEVGRYWKDDLSKLDNTIIFIEENNNFIFSKEFANMVKNSSNYFVLVNRSPIKTLPYSVHEIYEIITTGKHADVKESYHELKEIYSNYPVLANNKMKNILVEDSNSGYQFYNTIFHNRYVKSSNGNSNLINEIKSSNEDSLVIADSAAFGAIIENYLEYMNSNVNIRIALWLPESFEYLLLKSGIIKSKELDNILESTSDYVESEQFESWESFFTDLLIRLTKDSIYQYSKQILNKNYLTDKSIKAITSQIPQEIVNNI